MIKNKITSIQLLRAIACLLVLQLHLIPFIPFTNQYFFGAIGVDIFFVISGYIIASSISKIEAPKVSLKFLINRFCRVVPYYWILTFGAIIFIFTFTKNHEFEPNRIINSLLFIPQEIGPSLPLGWTLNHEMFFYLIIGLGSIIIPKKKIHYTGYFFLALLILSKFIPSNSYKILFLKSSINYTFLLGFFTFFYKDKILPIFNNNIMLISSIILICIVATFTCDFEMFPTGTSINNINQSYLRDIIFFQTKIIRIGFPRVILWGIPSYLLFLTFLAKESTIKDKYQNSIFVLIGDASYSIYLLQFFIVTIVLYFKPSNILFSIFGFIITILLSLIMVKFETIISKKTKILLLFIPLKLTGKSSIN